MQPVPQNAHGDVVEALEEEDAYEECLPRVDVCLISTGPVAVMHVVADESLQKVSAQTKTPTRTNETIVPTQALENADRQP